LIGRLCLALALAGLLGACSQAPLASVSSAERAVIAERLTQDIQMLASDEFGGRKPGTPGGKLTTDYLTQRFQEVGLDSGTNDPGNPWRAPVSLTSIRSLDSSIEITAGGRLTRWTPQEAIAVVTLKRLLVADAPIVFVGYEAQDVPADRVIGKVAVMLADESLNPERRILLEAKQASAVIVVPELAGQAGQNLLQGVRKEAQREKIALTGEFDDVFAAVATREAMARALGEERWAELLDAATRPDFIPVDLNATADIEAKAQRREFDSYNILGRLPGTQPDSEAMLLMAHWDHLGECRPVGEPDRICNGAVDNASGLALMLELVQRLDARGPYKRDIYVMATTGEESGLLGVRAFAANPPVLLERLVAAFNFDTVAVAPAGAPVGFIGEGRTDLDTLVLETLQDTKRELGDREYAARYLKRQDAWVLLQKGVPALVLSTSFGSEILSNAFFGGVYHSPADEAGAIELGGAIDDLLLHEELVRRLAIPDPQSP
jgi:aminopeptidase YwaD